MHENSKHAEQDKTKKITTSQRYRCRRSPSPALPNPPCAPLPSPLLLSTSVWPTLLHTSNPRTTVTIRATMKIKDTPACSSSSGNRSQRYSMSKPPWSGPSSVVARSAVWEGRNNQPRHVSTGRCTGCAPRPRKGLQLSPGFGHDPSHIGGLIVGTWVGRRHADRSLAELKRVKLARGMWGIR